MNKIFKVVWSKVRNAYVVVSEIAKNMVSGVGKRNRVKRFSMGATLAAVALTSSFFLPSEGLAADSALVGSQFYNYIAIAASWEDGKLVNPFGPGTQISTENGVRYINVNVDGRTLKYIYTMVDEDGVFDNNSSDDKAYWIRDGFGVKAMQDKYHIDASNVKLDLYKMPGTNATYDNISMSGAHTAEITSTTTAINDVALDQLVFRQYAAMTNSGGIDTPSGWCYYINRKGTNSKEDYDDVGGSNFDYNFYEFKSSEYNAITGKYTFKGQDVEYENIYKVGGKIGVFLTGYAYNASTASNSYDLPNSVKVYGGVVYGKNNEILLSGYDSEANTWSTVWAGEITDPYATIDSMTLSEFNEILHHLHEEDVKLADAGIVGVKAVEVTRNKEGSLNLVNKANNFANGLTVKSIGGTNGNDIQLTFTGEGTYVDAAGVTQTYNNSFSLDAGSKVVANGGTAYYTNQQLNTLTINGNVYSIAAGGNSGGTAVVSNITLTEGENIDIVGTTSNNVTNYVITAVDKDTKYTVDNGVKDNTTGNTVYTMTDDEGNTVGHITDTNTDTNTLYVVKNGVKDNLTGNTTYKVESSNGNEYSIIDTNNYVTNASVVGNNLVLERVGLENITVSLAALREGLATTDAKLIPNPSNSNGVYAVDTNGNITLKVQNGSNVSDVVININNVKAEVIGAGSVNVASDEASDGHIIYTVSATDNNTTYEVDEVTSNLENDQKMQYDIKVAGTDNVIGTIVDTNATLLNDYATVTPNSNGISNDYTIYDSAGKHTTIKDVASATKLQEVVTNVSNILDGTSLKLGVKDGSIALLKAGDNVHSSIGVTSSITDTNSNDATLTFTGAGGEPFSVNVGSVVRATNYVDKIINNNTVHFLKGVSINGTPYTIEDTVLSHSNVLSERLNSTNDVVGREYAIYDTAGNHVVLGDIASAEYVYDSFQKIVERIDDKRTQVKAGANVIINDPVISVDGAFEYTINAKDTTYSVITYTSNLEAGQKTKYEIKNDLVNGIDGVIGTIIDTDTRYEVVQTSQTLTAGQVAGYDIKDNTGGVIGTIIDNNATLKNQAATIKSTTELIDTYMIEDTAGKWTTIDVPSVTKLQAVVDDITEINSKISGAAGRLSVTRVIDDTSTANKKELGKINLLQGNETKSSVDVSVAHGNDTKDVVISFANSGVVLDITTGSIVKGTATGNKLTHLSINGHNYELFTASGVATYNNINIIDLGSSFGTGTDRHGWTLEDSTLTDPNHNNATYQFKDTTLDKVTSDDKNTDDVNITDYGYNYHIVDTAGNDIVLADVASAKKLGDVSVIANKNKADIANILNATSLKLGVKDGSIALLKEGNNVHSSIGITSSNTDVTSNDATLTFTGAYGGPFSVNVGSVVRATSTSGTGTNLKLNGISINGTPYEIKDTILDEGGSESAKQVIRDGSGITKIGYNYVVLDSSGNEVPISDVASAEYVSDLAEIVAGKTSRDVSVVNGDTNIEVTYAPDANGDVTYKTKLSDVVSVATSLSVGDNVNIIGATGKILADTVKANTSLHVGNVIVTSTEITGLSNRYWNPNETYGSGRAATEEQLQKAVELVQAGSVAGDKYVVSGVANGASKTGKIVLDMYNAADIEIDGLEDYALDEDQVVTVIGNTASLRVTDRYNGNNSYNVTISGIANASDIGSIGDINTTLANGVTNNVVNHINNLYSQVNTISANNSDWRLVGAYDSTATETYGYDNEYEVGDNNTITLNMQDKNSTGSQVKQVVIENVAKASDVGVISDINHSLATGTDNNVVNHINNLYTQVSAEAAKDTIVENGDANIVVSQPISRGDDTVYQVSLASNVYVNNSITVGTGTSKVILDGSNASVSAHYVTATTLEATDNFKVGDVHIDEDGVYGLNNTTWDSTRQYTGGRAATQEQLQAAIGYVEGNLDTKITNVAGEKIIGGEIGNDGTVTLVKDKEVNGTKETVKLTGKIHDYGVVAGQYEVETTTDGVNVVNLQIKDNYDTNAPATVATIKGVAKDSDVEAIESKIGNEKYEKTNFIKDGDTLTQADVKLDKAVTENRQVAISNYQDIQMLKRNDQYLDSKINQLGSKVNKVGAGAAALAALHPMDFDPDDKLSFAVGAGNYAGETATALGAFYRPNEKVMMNVAGTYGNGENMVNMGVSFALDRTNHVSNSRTAMAKEIVDLREQVATQGQQIAQLVALVQQLAGVQQPVVPAEQLFPDVPENHWAYEYVNTLVSKGIIEGYPDGTFGGDRTMTRYEFAAMLFRAMEQGVVLSEQIRQEFEKELGRVRVDRVKGADNDPNKIERVRVNKAADRDNYGSKIVQVKH